MSAVYAGVLVMTLLGWMITADEDGLMQTAFIIGLGSMTILNLLYLPDIVKGMTDPQVAEDLNIRTDETDKEDEA